MYSLPFTLDRRWLLWIAGGAVVVILCGAVMALVILGKTRRPSENPALPPTEVQVSSTEVLVPRHLDGVLVSPEEAALAPWAIMIDHQVAARPQSGVSEARVVIESPVEGGITRLLAFYAPTSTLPEIGPVRSARPYFVDWASAWNATYIHVGGSPEALERIKALGNRFKNINEMSADGWAFWRDGARPAPHSTMTNGDLLSRLTIRKGFASSTLPAAWHFFEAATSTQVGDVTRIAVPYGGSYNAVWRFDKDQQLYTRSVAGRKVLDKQGASIDVSNVMVIKTDEEVLDDKGRLRVRTTGSGEAIAYRDGDKFSIRWRRSPGEPMRFETIDGIEFLLRPGKTWIQVTTNDTIFAGLEK